MCDVAELSVFLCGDVMTGRGIDQIMPDPVPPRLYESFMRSALGYVELAERENGPVPRPVGFSYIWGDALAELSARAPAHRIANLETSITRSEDAEPKGINYRMSPANVGCIRAARLDCCVLANNHVLDWGAAGLLETLATLRAAGVATAGAGRDESEAAAAAVLESPGAPRVLVFAFGSPSSGVEPAWQAKADRAGVFFLGELTERTAEILAQRIRAERRPGDVVIVSIHWGGNWGYHVPAEQRAFAHALIDSGAADVVHGHSSHHPKGMEVYRDRLVIYGCGDFLNDYEGISGHEEFRSDLVLAYFAQIEPRSGRFTGLTMVPFRTRRLRLERATPRDAEWLAGVLSREGAALGTGVRLDADGALQLERI